VAKDWAFLPCLPAVAHCADSLKIPPQVKGIEEENAQLSHAVLQGNLEKAQMCSQIQYLNELYKMAQLTNKSLQHELDDLKRRASRHLDDKGQADEGQATQRMGISEVREHPGTGSPPHTV
jgi:hypothetical protein